MKKALLVISFGTAYKAARKRAVEKIENDLRDAFSDLIFYHAWTSDFLINKLKKTEGLYIDTVAEAMERMLADGVTDVIISLTHLLCGEEYKNIKGTVNIYKDRFSSLKLGAPLLLDRENIKALARVLESEFADVAGNEMLALMGHGSKNLNHDPYLALNEIFEEEGYPNFCAGTAEFEPNFKPISDRIDKLKPERVVLAPLLFVSGDHATRDMVGDGKDSWKSMIEAKGIETKCVLKGLGEYKKVREIYISQVEKL